MRVILVTPTNFTMGINMVSSMVRFVAARTNYSKLVGSFDHCLLATRIDFITTAYSMGMVTVITVIVVGNWEILIS